MIFAKTAKMHAKTFENSKKHEMLKQRQYVGLIHELTLQLHVVKDYLRINFSVLYSLLFTNKLQT
jgi:hypothetical protein